MQSRDRLLFNNNNFLFNFLFAIEALETFKKSDDLTTTHFWPSVINIQSSWCTNLAVSGYTSFFLDLFYIMSAFLLLLFIALCDAFYIRICMSIQI